jgi:hypothetical protein
VKVKVSPRSTAIIVGGVVGAALGATLAWAYAQAQEGKITSQLAAGRQLRLHAGAPEYVKIGISLLMLIRQVIELFKPM